MFSMVSNLYILNTTVKQSECEKFGKFEESYKTNLAFNMH